MMIKNHDESVPTNQNPNWPYILDHCCKILIIGGSGSGINAFLNFLTKKEN